MRFGLPLLPSPVGVGPAWTLLTGGGTPAAGPYQWAPGHLDIDDRLLVQTQDLPPGWPGTGPDDPLCYSPDTGGDLRKLAFLNAEHKLAMIHVMRQIPGAFDLETAVGEQQDMIGGNIDLPRRGYSDTRYRVFQRIQTLLLLSVHSEPDERPGSPSKTRSGEWTGTTPNLIKIVRTFIGGTPGDGAILFHNAPPSAYVLSIQNITLGELDELIFFLCRASYAGVLGSVLFNLADHSIWDSDTAGSAIADTGVWGSGSAGSTIANVATWGTQVAIGGDGLDC